MYIIDRCLTWHLTIIMFDVHAYKSIQSDSSIRIRYVDMRCEEIIFNILKSL